MSKKIRLLAALVLIAAVAFATFLAGQGCDRVHAARSKEVLFIIPHFWGVNYYLLQDVVDQYGWNVTLSGLSESVEVCAAFAAPRGAVSMSVDTLLKDISDISQYDAVVIQTCSQFSGVEPCADLLADTHTVSLLKAADEQNIPIMASCAGVRLLAEAGLITGKRVIGSKHFQEEYEQAGATYLGVDFSPVIEGGIITSTRGQYNCLANGQALATAMEESDRRGEFRALIDPEFIRVGQTSFSETEWTKTFGGVGADGAQEICSTGDGGFLIAGYTFSGGSGDADMLVIKVDSAGNREWTGVYGGPGTEYAYDCITLDHGYLVTGYTTSTGAGSKDICLIKLDSGGNLIWMKTYGGTGWDIGRSVIAVSDGFVICGHTNSSGAGEDDLYLVRTDRQGNLVWSRTYGGSKDEVGHTVFARPDGGFVIGGTTNSFGGANSDPCLLWADAGGAPVDSQVYHPTGPAGHGFDWSNRMVVTESGEFVLVGHSDCNDLMDATLIRIDAEGNEVWSKAFGDQFYDYGTDLYEDATGNLVVTGMTKTNDGNNDFLLAKVDNAGEVIWRRKIGGAGKEWAAAVAGAGDGSSVILGHTTSAGAGSFDIFLTTVTTR